MTVQELIQRLKTIYETGKAGDYVHAALLALALISSLAKPAMTEKRGTGKESARAKAYKKMEGYDEDEALDNIQRCWEHLEEKGGMQSEGDKTKGSKAEGKSAVADIPEGAAAADAQVTGPIIDMVLPILFALLKKWLGL